MIFLEARGLYQPDVIQEERIPLELLAGFGADVKQSPTFRVELSRSSTEAHPAEAIAGAHVPPRWLRRCRGHLLGGTSPSRAWASNMESDVIETSMDNMDNGYGSYKMLQDDITCGREFQRYSDFLTSSQPCRAFSCYRSVFRVTDSFSLPNVFFFLISRDISFSARYGQGLTGSTALPHTLRTEV